MKLPKKPIRKTAIWLSIAMGFLAISHVYSLCVNAYAVIQDKRQASNKLFEQMGRMESPQISESSGLANSSVEENSIWTINDSGHGAELYRIHLNGQTNELVELSECKNVDWEAMSNFIHDSQSFLLVADVGDNGFNRKTSQLYYFPEPKTAPSRLTTTTRIAPTRIEFVYEDGPKNCEAVAVDPLTNKCWLIEKVYYDSRQVKPPGIYTLDFLEQEQGKTLTARRIGDFPVRNVTGMAFSPDGKRLIVRNYLHSHLFTRKDNSSWTTTIRSTEPIAVPLPLQRQGEAICFTTDSKALIVTSELKRQAIWKVHLDSYLAEKEGQDSSAPPADLNHK